MNPDNKFNNQNYTNNVVTNGTNMTNQQVPVNNAVNNSSSVRQAPISNSVMSQMGASGAVNNSNNVGQKPISNGVTQQVIASGVTNNSNANSVLRPVGVHPASVTPNVSANNTFAPNSINSGSPINGQSPASNLTSRPLNNGSTLNTNANSTPVSAPTPVQVPTVPLTQQFSDIKTTAKPLGNIEDNASKDEKANDVDSEHEVIKILTSSFDDGKKKVNLLTPEHKEELRKKREEALKEKENYQPAPVSMLKRIMSIVFIIVLFLIVMFLPQINSYVLNIMNSKNNKADTTDITSGTLRCTLDRIDDKYNISYSYDFSFTDSKLKKLSYVEATVGDALVDADDLNTKLDNCNNLKSLTNSLAGIRVICSLSNGTLTREQIFSYEDIDVSTVSSAYVEAGGEYPGEFQNDSNIDTIEKNMKTAGYSCERKR